MNKICIGLVAFFFLAALAFADSKTEQGRVENAGKVIKEILNVPDNVPQDLLDKAKCVVVLPSVVKFAIGIGGSYGRGGMTCRTGENFNRPRGVPSIIAPQGGTVGFQLGGQAPDFVLLLMSQRSAEAVLSSKVKLGADASAAAVLKAVMRLPLTSPDRFKTDPNRVKKQWLELAESEKTEAK